MSQGCRLPDTVVPLKYSICYDDLDLDRCIFLGRVTISCKQLYGRVRDAWAKIMAEVDGETPCRFWTKVKSPVDRVELHALELSVISAVVNTGADKLEIGKIVQDLKAQTMTLCFDGLLTPGEAELVLKFGGCLNDKLAGLYRSKYTDRYGDTQIMAVTQFEATDARRAFPCWDEPGFKAKFELEVLAPLDRTVISNTTVMLSQEETARLPSGREERRRRWKFAETPVMSTYLLALVVGEFDFVSAYNGCGVLTTVYTPVGKAEQGKFALEVASKALEYYEETVFKVPYPLKKSDLVAIPDFAAGAMENWGCVTYREARLLVNDTTSSTGKKAIARTVCHELAHQWFGNLVTMEWWDALWLNEGFARYMEFVAVDHIFPEWDIWADFDSTVMPQAMELDSLLSSHPIEVEVHHPDQIREIFDAISYAKGASVIRMLAAYLGVGEFMQGIHHYLVKHSYGNARSDDLWEALGSSTGKDVASIMHVWTRKVGYPVLTLTEDGSTSQARFLALAASGQAAATSTKGQGTSWNIPVKVVWEGDGEMSVMLTGEADGGEGGRKLKEAAQSLQSQGKWFKVNAGQLGFFKVNYTKAGWEKLSNVLQARALPSKDRAGAVADAFSLASAGKVGMDVALSLAMAVKDDPDNLVRSVVVSCLMDLLRLYSEESFFEAFKGLVRSICEPMWRSITWNPSPGESQRVSSLRPQVLHALHLAGDKRVNQEALARFDAFMQDRAGSRLPADLRYAILAVAVAERGSSAFRQVLQIHSASDSGEERRKCLAALGRTKDKALLAEAMDFVLDSGEVMLPLISCCGSAYLRFDSRTQD